ncbi:glycine-rich domain-containing protein [Streptomyces sp. NPDC085479]|uniref:glycine-rich domain-containing protein n=1 Tax=Streptomyces sp. NPDC085479 TaxID=3365726 RepID=UPI0037D720A7
MTATANDLRTGRALVSSDLFDSIAEFTVIHFGYDREKAERATDQALAFLATVGTATVKMVPSDDVDGAVHAFILHTPDYREFCHKHAGRFLEHNPRPGGGGRALEEVQATAHAIKANGFMVLDALWNVNGENAAQCDSDCGRDYRAA